MPRPFRFGLQAMDFRTRDGISAAARQAESLGFNDFFSYDHFGAIDPFIPLMIAAEATERLRIGPLVLNNEFHHPALLARTAATVDQLTGGRLILGFGTGYMQSEHDAIGLLLRQPGERVSRFAESLAAVRSLLDTGAVTMNGDHHSLAIEKLGVKTSQGRVPFLIGGHGKRVVTIAAQFADIFQFTGLTHGAGGVPSAGGFGLEDVRERARWLTEAAAGRNVDIERSTLVQVTRVGGDVEAEFDQMVREFELPREVLEETPFVLIGSVEQVADKLERLREDLGISHVVVRDAEGFAPVVAALAGR